ncbi:angiotensin-converting enzyme-related protein-like [Teleopsis dalmanni]|uniref:angiotensin-converting enzyme-related protein-like n=1 Tax=Teleopsis dalmanni TaxID=139649 RepID=UPI0018CFA1ED|nr:angiotensin-converting enzyme-related protein-like [Teleopsis dalmanni]
MWLLKCRHLFALYFLISVFLTVRGLKENKTSTVGKTTDYEYHATNILDDATKRMQKIWTVRHDIFVNLAKGRGYNLINQAPIKHEIDNAYRNLVYELAANLSVIPVTQLKNHTLQRQVQRLSKLQLFGLRKTDYEEAKDMLRIMNGFLTAHMVCHVQHVKDCSKPVAMVPTILHHLARTKRLVELDYYWRMWRKAVNEQDLAKSTFINYVRLFRIAASYNGHVTPSRTWYLYYDTENFQRELEDVVWEIMPLYQEMHAYLRHAIRTAYGQSVTPDDGCLPSSVLDVLVSYTGMEESAPALKVFHSVPAGRKRGRGRPHRQWKD